MNVRLSVSLCLSVSALQLIGHLFMSKIHWSNLNSVDLLRVYVGIAE